ncbi:glycosyltransferase family 2 protein [Cypionkella sp.]|uniref:glycosyltransferase family 2 protein n=1 Tax=Cypionkella sp. TaxID=2811411 RepID=UPI003751FC87
MRALCILGVKNEGAFLLEWLAHHRACGFNDFLVYSNDCSDGTDLMLDRLAQMGWLTHLRNDGPHAEGPQWSMLKAADKHPLRQAADWILFSDIDEFVNIHVGDHRLPALLAALPQATAIPLTWRLFGNAGLIEITDTPVTESFTHAARASFGWPWRAQMFKTLFKNDGTYRKLGVHRPRNPDPERIVAARWFDGSGHALPQSMATGRIFSDYSRDNYQLVQLNHYALGSMQNYIVKADRGRANRAASGFDLSYWVERNFCEVEDRSILQLNSQTLRAELLADPQLATLHLSALAWRKSRFETLMQDEAWRGVFGRLLMTPTSKTLTLEQAAPVLRYIKPAALG